MLSKTERPNWAAPSESGPTSWTIRRLCIRLSGPQRLGLVQLIGMLQDTPFLTGMGQAKMGSGEGWAASATAQRSRLQYSETSSSAVGSWQGMKKLLPSAIWNSNRGEVRVHSEPLGAFWSPTLRRS